MKSKRNLRPQVTPKLKQRFSLWYVAGGVAVALLVGIGVFFYLNVGPTTNAVADTYSAMQAGDPTGPGGVGDATIENGFWLKADVISSNPGNTDPVDVWNDLFTNPSLDAVQTGNARPIYQRNVVNGQPALHFVGDDWLTIADAPEINISTVPYLQKTIIIVFKTGSDVTSRQLLYEQGGSGRGISFYIDNSELHTGAWNINPDDPTTPWPARCDNVDCSEGFVNSGVGTLAINTHYVAMFTYYHDGSDNKTGVIKGYLNSPSEFATIDAGIGKLHNHGGDIGIGRINGSTNFHNQQNAQSSDFYKGHIAEFIYYNRVPNDAERVITFNYLSAKYNIPLGSNDVYKMDDNGNYDYEVAGIGRLDAANFHDDAQGSGIVRVRNATNLGDSEFLLWGHDNKAVDFVEHTDVPADYRRLARTWRISEQGEVGSLDLRFNLSKFGFIDTKELRLLTDTDNDGSFADETGAGGGIIGGATSLGNGIYQFNSITAMQDQRRFTVARSTIPLSGPGGVGTTDGTSHLQLWLKADAGVLNGTSLATNNQAVNTWQDLSGARVNDATAAQLSPPTFRDNTADHINYNAVVDFDGDNDGLDFANDYIYATGTGTQDGMTWFAVVEPDAAPPFKNQHFVVDFGLHSSEAYGFYYQSGNYFGYTPDKSGLGGNRTNGASSAVQPTLTRFAIDFGVDQTFTLNGSVSAAATTSITLSRLTGTEIKASPTHDQAAGPFTIGRQAKSSRLNVRSDGARFLDGSIAELIGYNRDLPDSEVRRIESYLALKYGITLDATGGGTAGDYLLSNSISAWDASIASNYHHDVIGLAIDDNTSLVQKQSHQTDDSTRLYLSSLAVSNRANTGTFSSDYQALMIGHNNERLINRSSTEYPTGEGIYGRISREWKVTNTNFNGTFSMDIILEDADIPVTPSDLRVLIDADGNFSDATIHSPAISYANGVVSVSELSTNEVPMSQTRFLTLAFVSSNMTLPVELLYFRTKITDMETVRLEWKTASEINNDYFTVERSQDGTAWEAVTKVKGAGNTTEEQWYTGFDERPYPGTSYFRLKQTDFDGKFTYSEVVAATVEASKLPPIDVQPLTLRTVAPNPFDQSFYVDFELNQAGKVQIQLIGLTGRVVSSTTVEGRQGENRYEFNDQQDLEPGTYLLRMVFGDASGTVRIIKR